jgi:ribosome-binding protein aMBF1 (putative translation factor)
MKSDMPQLTQNASTSCSLGDVITAHRRARGWSQEEFAARMVLQGDATFRQSDVSCL